MESGLSEPHEGSLDGLGSRTVAIGALTTSSVVHAALVFLHTEDPLYAIAFGAAAIAAALVALVLSQPARAYGPPLAAVLLGSLLLAYPLVYAASGDEVDLLGIGTKVVEAVGLLAALRAKGDRDVSLAPVTVITGFLLAFLLLSVGGGGHQH